MNNFEEIAVKLRAIANIVEKPTYNTEGLLATLGNALETTSVGSIFHNKDNVIGEVIDVNQVRALTAKFEVTPITSLDKYTLRMPEGMSVEMLKYTTVLGEALAELEGMEDRLLKPLAKWTSLTLSDPNNMNLIWIQRNLELANMDKVIKLIKTITDGAYTDNVNGRRELLSVWPTVKEIIPSHEALNKTVSIANTSADMKIMDTVSGIARELNLISKESTSEESRKNFKHVARIIASVAEELEMLGILIFKVKSIVPAFNNAVSNLNSHMGS